VGDYYKRAAPTPPAEKHSRRASREIWSEGRLIFDTMPSRPSLQACATRAGRSSWSRCPLECRPGAARASRLASVALTQASELVGLRIRLERAAAWRPLPLSAKRRKRLVPRDGRDRGRKLGYGVALDLQRPVRVNCFRLLVACGERQEQRQV